MENSSLLPKTPADKTAGSTSKNGRTDERRQKNRNGIPARNGGEPIKKEDKLSSFQISDFKSTQAFFFYMHGKIRFVRHINCIRRLRIYILRLRRYLPSLRIYICNLRIRFFARRIKEMQSMKRVLRPHTPAKQRIYFINPLQRLAKWRMQALHGP